MLEKNDPVAFFAAILAAIGSPLFGEYAPIVVGAIFGGFVSVSKLEAVTRIQSLAHLMRASFVAIGLTAAIAWGVSKATSFPVQHAGFFVAFLLAWTGEDKMATIRDRLMEAAFGWLAAKNK